MKLKFLALLLLSISATFAQVKKKKTPTKQVTTKTVVKQPTEGIFAEMETSKGKIVIELLYKKAPVTVANFVSLAEGTNTQVADKYKGKPYYDGLKFHRVISVANGDGNDFMIQGGDPEGTGNGGPGYAFKDEFNEDKFDRPGILAMANAGPKTNGSQFFITHVPTPHLNGKHTIFGYVITGQDVVNKTLKNDIIKKVTIVRNGKAAKEFDAVKVFSDYFKEVKIQIEKENAERAALNAAALKEFENGKTTASGLKYIVITEGTGAMPTATSNVKVHYTGMLTNGKIFDSSVQRGEPIDFGLNQVIPGWTEGVQLMKEGAKYKFYIPYKLAYGERAMGNVIPAKSDLIFEVELLKINN